MLMIAIRSLAHRSDKSFSSVIFSKHMLSRRSAKNLNIFHYSTRKSLFSHRGGGTQNDDVNRAPNYEVSVCAVQGARSYMEDEFFISQKRDFCAVFDGHGGEAVSRYLRQNLYANLQAALPMHNNITTITAFDYQEALKSGLDKVDKEVQRISHWSFQGSTAVAAWIHYEEETKSSTLIVANVGDSRAILARNSTPIALTQDHKPETPRERKRIESRGGKVVWCGLVDDNGKPVKDSGVYRVNGNLALARAVGDRSERPAISAEPEFTVISLDDEAEFIILATDGLWDVLTNQEVVTLIKSRLSLLAKKEKSQFEDLRQKMASFVVAEALRRGSSDNVTVLILWLPSKCW